METKPESTEQTPTMREVVSTLARLERDVFWGRWILTILCTAFCAILTGFIWVGFDLHASIAENRARLQALENGQAALERQFAENRQELAKTRDELAETQLQVALNGQAIAGNGQAIAENQEQLQVLAQGQAELGQGIRSIIQMLQQGSGIPTGDNFTRTP